MERCLVPDSRLHPAYAATMPSNVTGGERSLGSTARFCLDGAQSVQRLTPWDWLEGHHVLGEQPRGPPCTFTFPACFRARSVLDHAPRQGLWPSLYSFCWCHQFLPFRSVRMSLLLFLGHHHQFLSDLFSTLHPGMGAEPREEGQPLRSAFLFPPKDLVCLVGSVLWKLCDGRCGPERFPRATFLPLPAAKGLDRVSLFRAGVGWVLFY